MVSSSPVIYESNPTAKVLSMLITPKAFLTLVRLAFDQVTRYFVCLTFSRFLS